MMKPLSRISILLSFFLIGNFCLLSFSFGGPDYTKTPVFFVHGHGMNAGVWNTMMSHLMNSGYPENYLEAIQLLPKNGPNIEAAENQIAPAIEGFLTSINDFILKQNINIPLKTKIDIVSHSMGGLSTRWYAAKKRPDRVHKWISLAGANHGSDILCSFSDPGADDLCPAYAENEQESLVQYQLNGNPNILDIDETPYGIGKDSPDVTSIPPDHKHRILYITIRTSPDEWGKPEDSVVLDGAGGISVPISENVQAILTSDGNILMKNGIRHDDMLADAETMRLVESILDLPAFNGFIADFERSETKDYGNNKISNCFITKFF